jgi:hypothetical protein
VELLIVVALLGILAAVVSTKMEAGLPEQLRTTGQIVAADLSYGASLAVAHNSQYEFTFDVAGNRYWLEHSGTSAALDELPRTPLRPVDDPPERHTFDLDSLPRLGGVVRLLGVVTTGGSPQRLATLEFDELGAVSSGQEAEVWLAAGGGDAARYISVRVDPVTGLAWLGDVQATAPTLPADD